MYSLREGRQAGEGEQFEMAVWAYFQPFGTSWKGRQQWHELADQDSPNSLLAQ